jgi:hypothetical protein
MLFLGQASARQVQVKIVREHATVDVGARCKIGDAGKAQLAFRRAAWGGLAQLCANFYLINPFYINRLS